MKGPIYLGKVQPSERKVMDPGGPPADPVYSLNDLDLRFFIKDLTDHKCKRYKVHCPTTSAETKWTNGKVPHTSWT